MDKAIFQSTAPSAANKIDQQQLQEGNQRRKLDKRLQNLNNPEEIGSTGPSQTARSGVDLKKT